MKSNREQIWIRNLDENEAQALTGTEDGTQPFWSPDGNYLGFFAAGKLKKIDIRGGPPITLANARNPRGATWSNRGVIVYQPTAEQFLVRIPASGGTPSPVTKLDAEGKESGHILPHFLPDGRRFLYGSYSPESAGIAIGDTESGQNVRVAGMERPDAIAASPGWLLFPKEHTLLAQPFDLSTFRLSGEPQPLATGVADAVHSWTSLLSVSNNGVVAYFSGGAERRSGFVLTDATGKPLAPVGPPGSRFGMWFSPNGLMAVEDRFDPVVQRAHLWLYDLSHGTDSRPIHDANQERHPVWSPDSKHVLYVSVQGKESPVYLWTMGDTSAGSRFCDLPGLNYLTDWSRDGRYVIATARTQNGQAANQIWVIPVENGKAGTPYLFLDGDFGGRISPDGRWLAFESLSTGESEVYVTSFPQKGPLTRVSTSGGRGPVWGPDGRKLYYVSPDASLMQVDVSTGAAFQHSDPRLLFPLSVARSDLGLSSAIKMFDVSPDGKRFLVRAQADLDPNAQLHIILNWPSLLRKRE
ncbi:MAG TPA: hypothetical protein VML19_15000 [Verrucomicrobiae bacterium]|nr:hypothetical protein [Verrucomicrobiae bacterium]